MKPSKAKIISPILCILAAMIWGVSFVAQSEGNIIGSATFIGIRSMLASLTLFIYILITDGVKKKKTGIKLKMSKIEKATLWKCGLACGLVLFVASLTQQIGIGMQGTETSVGRAGFLTAIYIILVPIFGIFFKKKVPFFVWVSVIIALLGLYIIAFPKGATSFAVSKSDIVILVCAVLFAFHIITCDICSLKADCIKISCIQFLIGGILGIIIMFIFEKPDMNAILSMAPALLYSGVLSGGVAFTLQLVSQKYTPPTLCALLLSLEAVFSALADWAIRGNTLSSREIFGCAIVFTAIILAQLPTDKIAVKRKN